jgi:hypothetical protein
VIRCRARVLGWRHGSERQAGPLNPSKLRFPLTDDQLEEMASHVMYERRTWQWALDGHVADSAPGPQPNALIELYNLHSRTLTEFLACASSHRDARFACNRLRRWGGGVMVGLVNAFVNGTVRNRSDWPEQTKRATAEHCT